jgi:hypothetical protein
VHLGRIAAIPFVALDRPRQPPARIGGEDSSARPSSVSALRKAIHLKLLPSSPQARPRTWPSPTIPVLISRAGPAATRGLGQPAP